jgi:tryptophan-rich sensory protein
VFLAQFLFQVAWSVSFYGFQQALLALVALLLLWCNTLLIGLLLWKKEKLAGLIFIYPFLWTFYLAGLNMVACISKP